MQMAGEKRRMWGRQGKEERNRERRGEKKGKKKNSEKSEKLESSIVLHARTADV